MEVINLSNDKEEKDEEEITKDGGPLDISDLVNAMAKPHYGEPIFDSNFRISADISQLKEKLLYDNHLDYQSLVDCLTVFTFISPSGKTNKNKNNNNNNNNNTNNNNNNTDNNNTTDNNKDQITKFRANVVDKEYSWPFQLPLSKLVFLFRCKFINLFVYYFCFGVSLLNCSFTIFLWCIEDIEWKKL